MASGLATEVQFVKGIGPKFAALYAKFGVRTVEDLLFHLPRRYQDRRLIPPISKVRPGEFATVRGRIRRVESRPISGGRVILKAVLEDATGSINLTWFNQPWVKKQLEAADQIIAYGMVKEGAYTDEISAPEWEAIDDEDAVDGFASIVPIYPLTEGLPQKVARNGARNAIENFLSHV
ncbi:MAG TPA: OB-fold nucleic acid binding domain-containing protein, partial [Fimbriimonas sp.]|nr:OB-fold nucleic acid binding domain-containing protein [Fimbriimonas sp.]